MHKKRKFPIFQIIYSKSIFPGIIITCATAALIFFSPTHSIAMEAVVAGEFVIEPPTLLCAGFEWKIEGDDNRNAAVNVSYRTKGAAEWKQALPLLRLHGEKTVFRSLIDYEAPNMFAGSIFDLKPGTEYECRFEMSDSDGVRGEAVKIVTLTTRSEPVPHEGGRILHVYPPDYDGKKEEPAFTGLSEAYYGTGMGFWRSAQVEPGDIILIHAGLYKANRLKYYEPLGLHFHGVYMLTKSGTPDKPIVIKAAGDGEAVFDGNGCYRLFDVMFADYTHLEGLTIRNTDVAVYAGVRYAGGCNGLVVRNCRMEDVGCGILAQYSNSKNFYIADNVILGRDDRSRLVGWTGMWKEYLPLAQLDSFIGIDINGQGHAVCHNFIAYFHDAIDITEQGPPEPGKQKCVSIDIYNNDLFHMADDFIEADCGVHNIRVFRNRGINAAHHGLSAQPIYGGPAYFTRNIVYNVPTGGAFKFNIYPSGVIVYHNTMCAEWGSTPPYSNVHLRNNLFLGIDYPKRPILRVNTFTSYTSFDYNGYRLNKNSEYQFVWKSPGAGKLTDYNLSENTFTGSFKTLEEFHNATEQEQHGTLVDYDIFYGVKIPDRHNPGFIYKAEDLDFRLRPGGAPVDTGCVLANVNDAYTGKAPDMGALEGGKPVPKYGPR